MTYQVFARRWRPKHFSETVGQEHVLKALANALDEGRLHHAYLFSGTRGVGKTTIARIVARCLNCEQGVSSTPCGSCRACVEIDEGRFVDLIEVDAASRTKVEDTRELLDNVQYAPSRGRYKVYLIDEVHMLSAHSFNALLKTLEEPPPHVQFLLATTDPQKLPATVLSRCVQFHLRNLSVEQIVAQLGHIFTSESIEYEDAALWALARAADGSMRDALSLAEQAVAMGEHKVQEAATLTMLGCTNRVQLEALVEALLSADSAHLLAAVDSLATHTPDYERILVDLLGILHGIAIAQVAPSALGPAHGNAAELRVWAGQVSGEDLQLMYQIGVLGRRDFAYAPDPRSGLEMVLLRMLAYRPAQEDDLDTQQVTAPGAAREAARPAKKPVEPAAGQKPSAAPAFEHTQTRPIDPAPAAPRAGPEATVDWHDLNARLALRGVVASITANCELLESNQQRYLLRLDERHASLYTTQCDERIAAALSELLGRSIRVEISQGALQSESPARRRERLAEEARCRARAAIEQDPNVRLLLERFSGTLHTDSIIPLECTDEDLSSEGI